MSFSRRSFFNSLTGGTLGALLGFAFPEYSFAKGADTLRAAAAVKGLRYGSSPEVKFPDAPPEFRELVVEQSSLFAPGFPGLSWAAMEPRRGVKNFDYGKAWCDFAIDHGLEITGAHLLWSRNTPDWFNGITGLPDARAAINSRIRDAMTAYAGHVFAWNVVNEQIRPEDGRPDGLGRTPFLDRTGPDFIVSAFKEARKWDANALLTYNDIDLELNTPAQEARRTALLRLLDTLQKAGAPIQAVGLESHLFGFEGQFNDARYRAFLHEISSRGLKIIISELDVSDVGLPTDIASRDRAVAVIYNRFLSVALDERAVIAVVTWGLSDRYTWLTADSLPKFGRQDGLPERPLPFDIQFQPKPAFYAILNALEHAPFR
ncbi:MAG TPA: endo-1,4-beta-xylanase [Rhizomicrobium sp.]|jgi:endo-1,4-beta-xylanase|nr:endo-1,4-beta-xylanase [Rhizomicrobium sp.]